MVILSRETIQVLEVRKQELLSRPYTDAASRTVEIIDILLGVQDAY